MTEEEYNESLTFQDRLNMYKDSVNMKGYTLYGSLLTSCVVMSQSEFANLMTFNIVPEHLNGELLDIFLIQKGY